MATMEAPPRLQIRRHEGAFKNEPFVDFSKEENVRRMRAAIEKVRGQLGREYDLIIGGDRGQARGKDPVHQSGKTLAAGGAAPEGWKRSGRARHEGGAQSL